ncbi:Phosphotransferase enzyme family [Aspergillus sclerotialis]|uniref:Altered inheritance of mitochondria protein 9, mitochondrial n=1 Tax=Aspergillus sclerotialis TaxID=2070753 RepID=A0A3A2ZE31_9EURO|nr:Phosphotransferase enzyme family [Aspergillus sclerotialis]
MATNDMQLVETYGRPRMNYHRSSIEPEVPDELLDLLKRYLKLAPAMAPPVGSEETHLPTLWHPDLHLDNVFVDPGSRQITQIIDWQSAAVMPFFYQCDIPRMVKNPGGVSYNWDIPELPDNYDSLDQCEKEKINSARESEICHKYYLAETKDQNPRHWATLGLESVCVRTEPSRLVVNVWEDRDVFFFRQALYSIAEQWEQLCPDSGSCPVAFSKQEIKAHAVEEEGMGNVAEILRIFRDGWGLPPDGMVDAAAFEGIRDAVAEMRDSFLSNADSEAERELFYKIWPYQHADD